MKLNLGCGGKFIEGFVNVDKYPTSITDLVFDLETTPWPWKTGTVQEVRFIHSLEHMGQSTNCYLDIIKEIYRICTNGATVVIHVPHPRHDNYLGDPTHVRPITPQSLTLFDKAKNEEWLAGGVSAATTLALFIGVDFCMTGLVTVLDPYWYEKYANGEHTLETINQKAKDLNNVIGEYQITLMARK